MERLRPEARRPFKVPLGFLFPVLGVVSCLYLMLSLSAATWVRFLVWLDLGMMIYWFYGRTHSPLADKQEQAAQGGAERAFEIQGFSRDMVFTLQGLIVLFAGAMAQVAAPALGRIYKTFSRHPAVGAAHG